ncbi:eCIS core domain-containing protein [Haliangium sp.]|uniref:eCIS core domain-containing protein n=1 Tax=Haliangium sp. TaxID=2663208 RepID=UPI003D0ECF92
MNDQDRKRAKGQGRAGSHGDAAATPRPAPGKRTRTMGLAPSSEAAAPVQRRRDPAAAAVQMEQDERMDGLMELAMRPDLHAGAVQRAAAGAQVQARGSAAGEPAAVHEAAAAGVSGAGAQLPHLDRIQAAFGEHDVSAVQAHVGGAAAAASEAIGASAYATGNQVAFQSSPDLHTAAHEAAHIVQQRQGVQLEGGVGAAGDAYERHADAVADRVVRGESAAELLGGGPGGSGAGEAVQGDWLGAGVGALGGAAAGAGIGALVGGPIGAAVGGAIGAVAGAIGGHAVEEAVSPDGPEPLAATELVLSRDPAYASEGFLGWFRGEIKAKVESWGLAFDGACVRLASADGNSVVALRWDPAWGERPATREVPLSMGPIDARAALTAAKALPGWAKLEAGDKTVLSNLLGGETNKLSQSARDHLRGMFAGLGGKSEDEQKTALAGIIGAKDAAPGVVDEEVTTATTAFELEGPVEKKDYDFRGKKADAEAWKAKFEDGVTVEIVAPKAPEAGYHYHSVQQAADAASYLPKAARSVIDTILLNVIENPDDAYWAVEYSQPGFHSYMTAGAAGVVTIYPDKGALPNDNYMRGTMIHETGHTWSYKTWGEDKTKGKWLEWKAAMDKDRVSVSGYAMASIAEDVAETIQVYVSTQGTPRFDEYKAMVPARFAMLATEYK